jgi:hypothetical protein
VSCESTSSPKPPHQDHATAPRGIKCPISESDHMAIDQPPTASTIRSVGALDYGVPAKSNAPTVLYRVALLCALLPLSVGTLIFLTYLATESNALTAAGFFTLIGGVILFIVGAGCLLGYGILEFRSRAMPRRQLAKRVAIAAVLLGIGFPVAWVYAAIGLEIESWYRITVVNASATPIDSFVLTAPGVTLKMGSIAPNGIVKHRFRANTVNAEGPMTFTATQASQTFSGTVAWLPTPSNYGARRTVTIKQNQRFTVQ